jgi:hypothetical protein
MENPVAHGSARPTRSVSDLPARLTNCPACGDKLERLASVDVCVSCSTGHCEPPRVADVLPPAPAPAVIHDTSNVTGLKGCLQCGSTFDGEECYCGARYDLPPPITAAEIAPQSWRIPHPQEMVCVECRVPRDAIGGRLVCPLCEDAKPLPSRGETKAAKSETNGAGSETKGAGSETQETPPAASRPDPEQAPPRGATETAVAAWELANAPAASPTAAEQAKRGPGRPRKNQ